MSDAGRQAEEHHAEVIRGQQARRVETLEAALREIETAPERMRCSCPACREMQRVARKALEES